jgi:hypothetical protein
MRRIFNQRERERVTGDWRKLNNEEFHNSHSSILKVEGKRPLGMRG